MKCPRHVVVQKHVGKTPLEAIQDWKAEHPEYAAVPASYAGRLDPMAEGKLLVLLGDECKKQDRYAKLDKEYEVELLLDIGSDTGDVLGRVSLEEAQSVPGIAAILPVLKSEAGTHMRPYPIFSSKAVNGTPLFLHALRGTLETISIPEHEESIYRIRLRSVDILSQTALQKRVVAALSRAPRSSEPSKALGADFRIHAVRNTWSVVFVSPPREYAVLRLTVTCGTGTYMRSLAGRVGKALGTDALALSIRRTRIGRYWHFGPISFWFPSY